MKKKQYVNPEMEVVLLKACQLLAGSSSAPIDEHTQDNGGALSRGWDDLEDF